MKFKSMRFYCNWGSTAIKLKTIYIDNLKQMNTCVILVAPERTVLQVFLVPEARVRVTCLVVHRERLHFFQVLGRTSHRHPRRNSIWMSERSDRVPQFLKFWSLPEWMRKQSKHSLYKKERKGGKLKYRRSKLRNA